MITGPPDGVLAALQAAEERDFDVAGHLPNSITTFEAVHAGWDTFEHLGSAWGFLLDRADAAPGIRAELAMRQPPPLSDTFTLVPRLYDGNATAPIYQAILATFNEATCADLIQLFVEHDVAQVPTLIRLRTMNNADDPPFRNDPNLQYLDPETRALREMLGQQFEDTVTDSTVATLNRGRRNACTAPPSKLASVVG